MIVPFLNYKIIHGLTIPLGGQNLSANEMQGQASHTGGLIPEHLLLTAHAF